MILFLPEVNNWMKLFSDCLHHWQGDICREPSPSLRDSDTTERMKGLETALRIREEALAQDAKLNGKGEKLSVGATAEKPGLEVDTPKSEVEKVCVCKQTWAVVLPSIIVFFCFAQESHGREARKET